MNYGAFFGGFKMTPNQENQLKAKKWLDMVFTNNREVTPQTDYSEKNQWGYKLSPQHWLQHVAQPPTKTIKSVLMNQEGLWVWDVETPDIVHCHKAGKCWQIKITALINAVKLADF